MIHYYGLEKDRLVGAIEDTLGLLERWSPGPLCDAELGAYKQSYLPALKAAQTQQEFVDAVNLSYFRNFSRDVGAVLELYAYYDVEKKGRNAFAVLRAAQMGEYSLCQSMLAPQVVEATTWCAAQYANKLFRSNRLALAWQTWRLGPSRWDVPELEKIIADARAPVPVRVQRVNDLMAHAEGGYDLHAYFRLKDLCGATEDATDRYRLPATMKRYGVAFKIAAGESPDSITAKIAALDALQRAVEQGVRTTDSDGCSRGVEGFVLKSVSFTPGQNNAQVKLGDGTGQIDASFRATDAFAAVVAAALPMGELYCFETRKVVKPPAGRALPPPQA